MSECERMWHLNDDDDDDDCGAGAVGGDGVDVGEVLFVVLLRTGCFSDIGQCTLANVDSTRDVNDGKYVCTNPPASLSPTTTPTLRVAAARCLRRKLLCWQ
ncbi:unnamed protein product [Ceratitis capitata]|uniref:(Mediterranean fruit fly) hypothetical protein n=1 Tax=Ceratitis capitata TaxID=7213 RepID=A0A811VDZ6_CERCA|nr:unnamed protein product [Ceratitis capitata]